MVSGRSGVAAVTVGAAFIRPRRPRSESPGRGGSEVPPQGDALNPPQLNQQGANSDPTHSPSTDRSASKRPFAGGLGRFGSYSLSDAAVELCSVLDVPEEGLEA